MPELTPFGNEVYKLQGLKLQFARHHDALYPNAHKKLQQNYGGTITDIDDLWTDSERTTLASTIALIIRRKIIAEILLDACDTVDKTRISPFFQNGIIKCLPHDELNTIININTTMPLRQFSMALSNAKEKKQPFITLLIVIGSWHFKPYFNPVNFDDFQLAEAATIKQRHAEDERAQALATKQQAEADKIKQRHNQGIRFAAKRRRCEIEADQKDKNIKDRRLSKLRRLLKLRNRDKFRNGEAARDRRQPFQEEKDDITNLQSLTLLAPIPLLSHFQILKTFENARSHHNELPPAELPPAEPPPAEPPPKPKLHNFERRINWYYLGNVIKLQRQSRYTSSSRFDMPSSSATFGIPSSSMMTTQSMCWNRQRPN